MARGDILNKVILGSRSVPQATPTDRGIGCLVLADDTNSIGYAEYTSLDQVTETDWTELNYKHIKDFLSVKPRPTKLLVLQIPVSTTDIIAAINPILRDSFFNYLAVPSADEEIQPTWNGLIEAWIIARSEDDIISKFSVFLAYNTSDGDHPQVINWTQDKVKQLGITYEGEDLLGLVLGCLCGVSGNQESINALNLSQQFDFEDGTRLKADSDTDSINGELFVVKRNGNYRFSRGVNSLVTLLTPFESSDYQLIDVADEVFHIANSVVQSWESTFLGVKKNTFDFKMAFIDSVFANIYQPDIDKGLLDPDNINTIELDLSNQITFILAKGLDPADLSELEIKRFNTSNEVAIESSITPTTAATDLNYTILI